MTDHQLVIRVGGVRLAGQFRGHINHAVQVAVERHDIGLSAKGKRVWSVKNIVMSAQDAGQSVGASIPDFFPIVVISVAHVSFGSRPSVCRTQFSAALHCGISGRIQTAFSSRASEQSFCRKEGGHDSNALRFKWGSILVASVSVLMLGFVLVVMAVLAYAFSLGWAARGAPDSDVIQQFANRVGPVWTPRLCVLLTGIAAIWLGRRVIARPIWTACWSESSWRPRW